MFHEGSLQSGISRAIQEQKLVACFVRDDGSESIAWEDDWLQSGWISNLLAQKAILLRLDAGSTEAGFLSAFCPISQTPTFVVIQNGQLRDQLVNGVGKDEFINRIRKVLGADPIPGTAPSSNTPQPAPTPEPEPEPEPEEEIPQPEPVAQSNIPEQSSTPSPSPQPTSKGKGKQRATSPEPQPDLSATRVAQQTARDALRKKKQEEKEELARIKARIEADKAERKAQAEARKAERERERLGQSSPTTSQFPATTSTKGSQAKDVHLNVRLFDGRTIRSTFPRTAKLQDDVRPWIDQEFAARAENPREKHPPYFFKQILAPLPSRELSAGDENETLGDIDLAPSATLVLVPIKGYTEAYSGAGGGVVGGVVGGVTGIVGGVFGLASSAVGLVGSTLGSIVGYGGTSAQQEQQPAPGRTLSDSEQDASNSSNIRVRTLADQRAREPRSQQLYNGNQLNFEPRDDETNRR